MKTRKRPTHFSHPSRFGISTFFENSQYYFLFNDKEGEPIFYSHGYQSERSRDNGIQVAVRNAGEEEHYERQQSKNGQYFFLLKSGNNQEIGRSITFDNEAEMEEKLQLMRDITEKTPIFDAAERAAGQQEEKAKGIVTESEKAAEKELPIENMPRYKFSIIYYPDSDVWIIKHDQSGNSRQFKTCDGQLIEAFLRGHLPIEKPKTAAAAARAEIPLKPTVQEGIPRKQDKAIEEEIEFKLRIFNGEEAQHIVKAGDLIRLEALPKKSVSISPDAFHAKVVAKPLDRKETVVVAEVKDQKPAYDRFLIPIYEANKLAPGMYRFTVKIHQGKEGEEVHDYTGSSLVMLN